MNAWNDKTSPIVRSQQKIAGADIRVAHWEGGLKGAISAHRLSLERFLSDGKIRIPMGGIQNVGIEQKLKITRHAVGDGAAFDRVAYRAYGKRGYAITAIDLYSRIGLP